MPRTCKTDVSRKYRKYNKKVIEEALEQYETTPNCTIAQIANKYNIPRSILYRHSNGHMKKQGQNALNEYAEREIVKYINICSKWGYPINTYDLRIMIKSYLDNIGVTHIRFKNNMPGPDYANKFLMRHKAIISTERSHNITKSKAQMSPILVTEYFKNLEESLKDIDPQNIVSYDETNLWNDPGRKKIMVKRGTKYPEKMFNQSKSSLSIIMSGTAAGELLPTYVIYKAQTLYDAWTIGGPEGTRYNRTATGWLDIITFTDYIRSIIIPYFKERQGRKVLIADNLSCHLSVEVVRICEEQNISFIFFPANSTHLTQPLDIAFFRPMNISWRKILVKWKKTWGKKQAIVPKVRFPKLLKLLINDLSKNVKANLQAGFKKAGIFPIDADQVLSRLPANNNKNLDKTKHAKNKPTNVKNKPTNVKEPTRKRKLNAEPGTSLENINNDSKKEIKRVKVRFVLRIDKKEKTEQQEKDIKDVENNDTEINKSKTSN